MVSAVEKVRNRLLRVTQALNEAKVDYAVVGGNAVAAWVATVDEAAVRNTQDVDILLRRADLEAVKLVLENKGFTFRHAASLDMFLDGESAKVRDAVHILFVGERVHPDQLPNPDVANSVQFGHFRVLSLEALVQIKLTAWRYKDRTHLLDMLEVGLIDAAWVSKYPQELGIRLQHLIDTPGG